MLRQNTYLSREANSWLHRFKVIEIVQDDRRENSHWDRIYAAFDPLHYRPISGSKKQMHSRIFLQKIMTIVLFFGNWSSWYMHVHKSTQKVTGTSIQRGINNNMHARQPDGCTQSRKQKKRGRTAPRCCGMMWREARWWWTIRPYTINGFCLLLRTRNACTLRTRPHHRRSKTVQPHCEPRHHRRKEVHR